MTINVRLLKWAEVDPLLNPFDSSVDIPRLHTALVHHFENTIFPPKGWENKTPDSFSQFISWPYGQIKSVTSLVTSLLGKWACGWNFSRGEGYGDGGVVSVWCCEFHSFFADDTSPKAVETTIETIKAAVCEWRQHLQEISDLFKNAGIISKSEPRDLRLEQTAIDIILLKVIEATECHDAWYGYLELVLIWFLEYSGWENQAAKEEVKKILANKKFKSWAVPEQSLRQEVSGELSHLIRNKN